MDDSRDTRIGRRDFVGMAAAATAGFTILKPSTVFGTQANSAVRLGVLGCGGRGTAVTESFLQNTGAIVTAMGDIFQDNLEKSAQELGAISRKFNKPFADAAHMFKGFKAYEQLFASKDIDAVYIATPPYFHPDHLEAASAAGKHVYLEKPVAVDVPGARRIMALGEKMKGKLSLAVGFQIRYASPYVLLEKRIREGQIGSPVSGQVYYFASNINRPPFADKSADERRLRNWIYEKTISGDIIVEQNIHIIDVTNWLLAGRPLKAYGRNGRAGRTDSGDCSSHYNCVFTYPKDVHISFSSTQFGKAAWGVGMQLLRDTRRRGSAVPRTGAHLRRNQLGVPGPRPAAGGRSAGGGHGPVPRRARRRGRQQAGRLHRQRRQRQPAERSRVRSRVGPHSHPRPDGGRHGPRNHLGRDDEVDGGLRPEDQLRAVCLEPEARSERRFGWRLTPVRRG